MVTRKNKIQYARTLFLSAIVLYAALTAGLFLASSAQAVPMLRVLSVTDVSPSSLTPGESDTLKITLENDGDYDAENVVISWTDPEGAILSVGSGNTKSIGTLAEGEDEKLEFDVTADGSAEPGLYQIAITMTYVANNETIEQLASAGIKIGGDTDFEVIVSDVAHNKISLSIINVGSNPARAMTLTVPKQDGYEPIGAGAISIGKLAADDYVVVPFDIKAIDTDEELEIELSYTDTDGDRKTVESNIELETYQIEILTGANLPEPTTNWTAWVVSMAIVVVIVGLYFRKRAKRRKREAED